MIYERATGVHAGRVFLAVDTCITVFACSDLFYDGITYASFGFKITRILDHCNHQHRRLLILRKRSIVQ